MNSFTLSPVNVNANNADASNGKKSRSTNYTNLMVLEMNWLKDEITDISTGSRMLRL